MNEQEQTQTRNIYVVNLDRRRMAILGGCLLMICALFFYLGGRWNRTHTDSEEISSGQEPIPSASLAAAEEINPAQNPALGKSDPAPARETGNAKNRPQQKSTDILPPLSTLAEKRDAAQINDTEVPLAKDPMMARPDSSQVQGPPRKAKTGKTVQNHNHKRKSGEISHSNQAYFTVQVAAFGREKDARLLLKKLTGAGLKARIDKGRKFYFVRAGKSSRRDELEGLAKTIAKKVSVKPIVVRKNLT